MGELEKLEWERPGRRCHLQRSLRSNLYYSFQVFLCLLSWFFVPVDSQRVAHAVILSKNGMQHEIGANYIIISRTFGKTYNLSGNCFVPGCSGKEKENTIVQLCLHCRPAADEHWNIQNNYIIYQAKKKDWNERHEQTKGVHARYTRGGQETNTSPPACKWHGWLWFPSSCMRDSGTEVRLR